MLPAGQQVSEEGMSAMERLKVWLNQKIANILGDVQEQEPVEDPIPMRAGCRIFFMVSLLVGFSLLLAYTFNDAPDTRVVQIHHVTPGGKNHAFPSCFLYDRNLPNCTKWSKAEFPKEISVSCLCTNTTAPWRDFVKFYALQDNSADWKTKFSIDVFLNSSAWSIGNESIVSGNRTLTAQEFCKLSYLCIITTHYDSQSHFHVTNDTIQVTKDMILYLNCIWMAGLLFPPSNFSYPSIFPNKYYEDRTRSTRFLNTPSLLRREELNTLLAKLAQESVLSRQLALDIALSIDVGNNRRFYNALAHLLIGLLDRDKMDPSENYVYGAQELSLTLISNVALANKSMLWYLEDDLGLIFLQPEIDWEGYRETCSPEYCEVIMPMGRGRKLYWAFGILGGVGTIVLAVVTMLLWPCTAMLLLWISERKTTEKGGPGTSQVALVAGPQTVELSSPLDSKTLDSKPQHAELSNPLDPKTLDSKPQPAQGALS